MHTPLIILSILGLFGLNIISHYQKKLVLPEIVWVLIAGIFYGIAYINFPNTLENISLNPGIILYVFVPILIFASARKMCFHHFKKVLFPASIVASLGLIISTGIIGGIVHIFLDIPLLSALLFGVIISATDPIAVASILEKSKLSESKKLLIEGESILNDGFTITFFTILSAIIIDNISPSVSDIGINIIGHIGGSIIIGFILAKLARFILETWHESNPILKVNMGIIIAYGSFLLAESFHTSGIIATFVAGLTYTYMPPKNSLIQETTKTSIWNYLEYITNALLFFILGVNFATHAYDVITIGGIILALTILIVGRTVALEAIGRWIKVGKKKLTFHDRYVLNIAGSRGAISIALILLLPDSFEYKQVFLCTAFIVVVFSLIIYPLLLQKTLKKMK